MIWDLGFDRWESFGSAKWLVGIGMDEVVARVFDGNKYDFLWFGGWVAGVKVILTWENFRAVPMHAGKGMLKL